MTQRQLLYRIKSSGLLYASGIVEDNNSVVKLFPLKFEPEISKIEKQTPTSITLRMPGAVEAMSDKMDGILKSIWLPIKSSWSRANGRRLGEVHKHYIHQAFQVYATELGKLTKGEKKRIRKALAAANYSHERQFIELYPDRIETYIRRNFPFNDFDEKPIMVGKIRIEKDHNSFNEVFEEVKKLYSEITESKANERTIREAIEYAFESAIADILISDSGPIVHQVKITTIRRCETETTSPIDSFEAANSDVVKGVVMSYRSVEIEPGRYETVFNFCLDSRVFDKSILFKQVLEFAEALTNCAEVFPEMKDALDRLRATLHIRSLIHHS